MICKYYKLYKRLKHVYLYMYAYNMDVNIAKISVILCFAYPAPLFLFENKVGGVFLVYVSF